MTTDETDGNELDCYEASEARTVGGVIHLGMDATLNEEQMTYWNVFVPAKWDCDQRLLLLTKEEFETISMVLTMEAFTEGIYSPFSKDVQNTLDNLITPNGLFHSPTPIHQCPDCQTVLIPLGDNHWVCDRCAVTLDSDFEMVALIEDENWVEMDPQTQEWDDALSIVRNEAMEVIDDPNHVYSTDEEIEATQAYADYGGPNHSNHDDFEN